MLSYECFAQKKIDIAKCTLDLHHYTIFIKASILYNHLADAKIPLEYINKLLEDESYMKLIKHPNFNPRVIETFINERIWESVRPESFVLNLLCFLTSRLTYGNMRSKNWKCLCAMHCLCCSRCQHL